MQTRDFPYNDFPYQDFPYNDFPYETDMGGRHTASPTAPAIPRRRSRHPVAGLLLFLLRTAPISSLAWLCTRLLETSFTPATLCLFALLCPLSWLLFRYLKTRCIPQKQTGSKHWIPLYLIVLFWACLLPSLTWFNDINRLLHFHDPMPPITILLFLFQAILSIRFYRLIPIKIHGPQNAFNRS